MSVLKKVKNDLGAFCGAAVDLVLPPRCIQSGEIVDRPGMVSPVFFSALSFIEKPFCATCGLPFAFDVQEGTLCGACLEDMPDFTLARAAVVYNDASRDAILSFKYGDRMHAVDTFTPWLMRAGGEMIRAADLLVPVPLHPKRLWQRRFNQSAILAAALSQRTGKPHLPDALTRHRYTIPQKGLSRNERGQNVKNAFAIDTKRLAEIHGKNVLLLDDVYTSGATLNECSRTLFSAGAAAVYVLTIARVTREDFQ